MNEQKNVWDKFIKKCDRILWEIAERTKDRVEEHFNYIFKVKKVVFNKDFCSVDILYKDFLIKDILINEQKIDGDYWSPINIASALMQLEIEIANQWI